MKEMKPDAQGDADLLYGVAQIAAHLGLTARQIYHHHDAGTLPTFKLGGRVCARRSTLAEHFAGEEARR